MVAAISIREAAPADAGTIAAFNAAMARETEDKTLNPAVVGPGVEALLEDASKGRYWVAERAGEVVGQRRKDLIRPPCAAGCRATSAPRRPAAPRRP